MSYYTTYLPLLSLAGLLLYIWLRPSTLPLPPGKCFKSCSFSSCISIWFSGPKGIPLLGNLHQLPLVNSYKKFYEWKQQYGPIVYFHTLGRQFIILNEIKPALDLFEKRSAIYNTRPPLIMAGELVGKTRTSIVFAKAGKLLKECRRIAHSWMNKQAIQEIWPALNNASVLFLKSMLDDPERSSHHIRTHTGTILLRLLYGIHCLPEDDPHIARAEHVCDLTAKAMQPGRWMCDIFPSLIHLPSWLPGVSFKRWAAQARISTNNLISEPYANVLKDVLNGTAEKSWLAGDIVDESGQPAAGENAEYLMVTAGSLYAAGIDTTVSATRTFFLMMLHHPEIQAKAQEEVDRVVGSHRIPNMADIDSLPYLRCVFKEVLRVTAVAPLLPHSLERDDVYNGYLIPKNTCVMVNVWAIFNDPENYPSPELFKPERFDSSLGPVTQFDPENLSFGLGRRSCVGIQFAQAWILLNMAQVLHVFDIQPIDGKKIPTPEYTGAAHIRCVHFYA
ncbi:cytochrome P450 [Crucibulum laeve]|uniref:Cytochrome P450 n=1 Tax=Crucibulum laeve TaxID=68775 RepID=A0A5C3LVK5_9AGAR|nr:cytochrome P450 [Crucibulum laeve]